MGGYVKNIAVIKTLKGGFSSDGGPLSGLVRCEKYGGRFRVDISYINFAPLSEGRYVCGITDGYHTEIVENGLFDGESELDNGEGFAALVCYVNKAVEPIATAVCGNFSQEIPPLKDFIARGENLGKNGEGAAYMEKEERQKNEYDDDAIAEENYYEYGQVDEMRVALCARQEEETIGDGGGEDEEDLGAVAQEQGRIGQESDGGEDVGGDRPACQDCGAKKKKRAPKKRKGAESVGCETVQDPLSHGASFYGELKEEISRVLSSYPKEEKLCAVVQNSEWVRIRYGGKKFYVFGVIYANGAPKYVCYGVPSKSKTPPKSLKGLASFIPADRNGSEEGYWVMYQDAATGASVSVEEA